MPGLPQWSPLGPLGNQPEPSGTIQNMPEPAVQAVPRAAPALAPSGLLLQPPATQPLPPAPSVRWEDGAGGRGQVSAQRGRAAAVRWAMPRSPLAQPGCCRRQAAEALCPPSSPMLAAPLPASSCTGMEMVLIPSHSRGLG